MKKIKKEEKGLWKGGKRMMKSEKKCQGTHKKEERVQRQIDLYQKSKKTRSFMAFYPV